MKVLKHARPKAAFLLPVIVMLWCPMIAAAQRPTDKCRPATVIPLAVEPPAKLVIDPPLAEPLASRGVVVIQYCAENLHFVPVFGPKALAVSPRVGHLHVSVDDASWVWMDASGNPIILMGLSPGPHKVLIELKDANHHTLDQGTVKFVVPEKTAGASITGEFPLGFQITRLHLLAAKASQAFVKLQESFVDEALLFRRRTDFSRSTRWNVESRAIR